MGKLDQPIKKGDLISADLMEAIRLAVKKEIRVAAPLQMTVTAAGTFISLGEDSHDLLFGKLDTDGASAREAESPTLGKGRLTPYKYTKTAGSDPDVDITTGTGTPETIQVYNYLQTEIDGFKNVVCGWVTGLGWLIISADCSQTDNISA